MTSVFERVVVVYLSELGTDRVMPFGITVERVKPERVSVVARYFELGLVLRGSIVLSELCLIHHAKKFLFLLGNTLEMFPPGFLQKVVCFCIQGTNDRVLQCNFTHRFR